MKYIRIGFLFKYGLFRSVRIKLLRSCRSRNANCNLAVKEHVPFLLLYIYFCGCKVIYLRYYIFLCHFFYYNSFE
ncbi:hypothetical protein RchiOBHm_Chr1g0336611 [Rosa chinensis]|uniref:Uncharacterized protein n=1 Tax=Rosa chinensis TaxID=74649 RepID=A0A2P6SCP7_ROSCH|nr:hypothetical protein RchiOBHm_Chr1g0336611 [Rosa chinensis]